MSPITQLFVYRPFDAFTRASRPSVCHLPRLRETSAIHRIRCRLPPRGTNCIHYEWYQDAPEMSEYREVSACRPMAPADAAPPMSFAAETGGRVCMEVCNARIEGMLLCRLKRLWHRVWK